MTAPCLVAALGPVLATTEDVTAVRSLFLSLALLVLAGAAGARELASVTLPDRVEANGKSLVLNGMGIRKATLLKVKVYVAGLYLETRSSDAARVLASPQTKRLVLQFVRDVKRDQVVEAWDTGFAKNGGSAALAARIRKLDAWMTDFHPGDRLTFTHLPGKGIQVDVGSATKGTIEGDDFARALLSIWLGPEPPNASLKDGLLGKE